MKLAEMLTKVTSLVTIQGENSKLYVWSDDKKGVFTVYRWYKEIGSYHLQYKGDDEDIACNEFLKSENR
jgi:hypothetical protein